MYQNGIVLIIFRMNDLINFFIKFSRWFVFAFYVILGCILLFNNNPYQHHIYLTSAGSFISTIYKGANSVSSYYNLREINDNLQSQCANLELEIIKLRDNIRSYQEKYGYDSIIENDNSKNFEYIFAHVINNSISHPHNYITLNKGELDGIKPEMGVIDQNGVVGIVNIVGKNSSRVISLLNPHLRLSCKIKGTNELGSLVWDGKDPSIAILEELPRHTKYNIGDTIITSGFSAVFPEGIIVGTIFSNTDVQNENFFKLKIKLSTDFNKLSTTKVIISNNKFELDSIESITTSKQ